MNVLNQYPSTDDLYRSLPRLAGAQDDPTLDILEGARKRFKRRSTAEGYISNGSVCAMGAIGREIGLKDDDIGDPETFFEKLEAKADRAAKEAIKLVNASAIRLYPESLDYEDCSWKWPLEYLNQEFSRPVARKKVLACYDDAIARATRLDNIIPLQ